MTCNPNHPHILAAIDENMDPSDRPDIIARIFKQHVQELINMLYNGDVPGWENAIGQIYVIEFQKRGLPHVHLLVILKRDYAIEDDDIDKYAVARIPDRDNDEDDKLWNHVVTKMVHRPCGEFNSKSKCMDNVKRKCCFGYPKEYQAVSYIDESGSAIYKRLSPDMGGNSAWISTPNSDGEYVDYEITDRDIVPYNAFLLKHFNCHINVEVCSSIKIIKYLLWYPFKVSS